MGGDGTFSECLQGLAELHNFQPLPTPVGLLPGGSGNSFLRDFDAHTYEAARDSIFEAVENQETIPVDIGLCSYQEFNAQDPETPGKALQRLSFNIWGLGLIAEIAALAIKMILKPQLHRGHPDQTLRSLPQAIADSAQRKGPAVFQ